MNDLEICKRIAIIEKHFIDCESVDSIIIFNGGDGKAYNPLTDDALCFQLMVKYDVDVMSLYRVNKETEWEAQVFTKDYADAVSIYNTNPNKAICLAIIEAHKEQ